MSCSLAYSRRHVSFVLSLPFPYLPMFSGYSFLPVPVFALKSPMVIIIMCTFVYSVGDFTQIFLEIFPDGWGLLRDYQGRRVSKDQNNVTLIQLHFGLANPIIHSSEGCWNFFFYEYSYSCVFVHSFYSTVIDCVVLLLSSCSFYCTVFDVCFSQAHNLNLVLFCISRD